jgi:hypothetical protein
MSRTDRLSPYKTSIRNGDGKTIVRYHQTDVVTFTADYIILRTGGWRSVTTLRKMNQAARQFGLNYAVHQRAGEWFVTFGGLEFAFDGDEFNIPRSQTTARGPARQLEAAQ